MGFGSHQATTRLWPAYVLILGLLSRADKIGHNSKKGHHNAKKHHRRSSRGSHPQLATARILFQSIDKLTDKDFVRVLKKSRKLGLDLNSARDQQGMSLLHHAARAGLYDGCVEILKDGVDVNLRDTTTGSSALHFACGNRHAKLAAYLVDKGARPMARDRFGTTPLDLGLKSYVQRYPVKHNKEFSWLCRHYDPEVSDMYYLSDEKLHEHKLKQESIQQERRESEAFSRRQNAIEKELEKRRKEEDTKREELEKQYSSAAMIAAQAAWEAARSRSTQVPIDPPAAAAFSSFVGEEEEEEEKGHVQQQRRQNVENTTKTLLSRFESLTKKMDSSWRAFESKCKNSAKASIRMADVPLPNAPPPPSPPSPFARRGSNSKSTQGREDLAEQLGEGGQQPEIIDILEKMFHINESRARKEMRKLFLRWHPDKFSRKIGPKLLTFERKMVESRVSRFARFLTAITDKMNNEE